MTTTTILDIAKCCRANCNDTYEFIAYPVIDSTEEPQHRLPYRHFNAPAPGKRLFAVSKCDLRSVGGSVSTCALSKEVSSVCTRKTLAGRKESTNSDCQSLIFGQASLRKRFGSNISEESDVNGVKRMLLDIVKNEILYG